MSNIVFEFISLHYGEEDKVKVLENVKSNISFRGSNLWILACAIVIASVGLNVNSTAVIIGAMLISPLMGPIVGAGFALAIYDFDLLKKSLKNLFIATIVSLIVATVYFFISPFKETQSELLARTSPNIYDVLIAFFGGLVGVIALTRVEKGNPVPGVAIATALMPPLCTAGYALALGNYSFFIGAFYLYTINCFFICIATFFIIKYLKYQPVKTVNKKFEKQIRVAITALVLVMIIPSFYLAYNLFQEKKYSQKVDSFIANEFTNNGYTLIYKNIKFNSNPKIIEIALLSKTFNEEELQLLHKKLKLYNINNTNLDIKQDSKNLKSEILNELGYQDKIIREKDFLINNLQNELKEYTINNELLYNELIVFYPNIKQFSLAKHSIIQPDKEEKIISTPILLIKAEPKLSSLDEEKINNWIKKRLSLSSLIVHQID